MPFVYVYGTVFGVVEIDKPSRFSLPSFSVDQEPIDPSPNIRQKKKSAKHRGNDGEIFDASMHRPRSFGKRLRDSYADAGVPIQDGTVSSQLRTLLEKQRS